MNRFYYILEKIEKALKSGTLIEKGVRFFRNQVLFDMIIPLKSFMSFNNKLELNFSDGFKDHRLDKDFLMVNLL